MTRNRLARSGQHPREARIQESTINDGLDEDAKFDSAAAAAKAKAASSAAASNQPDDSSGFDIGDDIDPEKWKRFQRKVRTTTTTPTTTTRQSDQLRQQQPKILDKEVGDDYKDWTTFGVGRSMRISALAQRLRS